MAVPSPPPRGATYESIAKASALLAIDIRPGSTDGLFFRLCIDRIASWFVFFSVHAFEPRC